MGAKSDRKKPGKQKSGKGKAKPEKKKNKKNKNEKKSARPDGEPESRLQAVLDQIGPEFIEQSARRMSFKDLEQIVDRSDEILEQFKSKSALDRYQKDGEMMLGLVLDFIAGRFRDAPLWAIGVAGFTLAYVLKPIDIIPDSLPVIGQLDDAIVVSHSLAMIRPQLSSYRVWKLATEVERG